MCLARAISVPHLNQYSTSTSPRQHFWNTFASVLHRHCNWGICYKLGSTAHNHGSMKRQSCKRPIFKAVTFQTQYHSSVSSPSCSLHWSWFSILHVFHTTTLRLVCKRKAIPVLAPHTLFGVQIWSWPCWRQAWEVWSKPAGQGEGLAGPPWSSCRLTLRASAVCTQCEQGQRQSGIPLNNTLIKETFLNTLNITFVNRLPPFINLCLKSFTKQMNERKWKNALMFTVTGKTHVYIRATGTSFKTAWWDKLINFHQNLGGRNNKWSNLILFSISPSKMNCWLLRIFTSWPLILHSGYGKHKEGTRKLDNFAFDCSLNEEIC